MFFFSASPLFARIYEVKFVLAKQRSKTQAEVQNSSVGSFVRRYSKISPIFGIMIPNDPQWPISGFQKSQTTGFFFRLHPGVVVDVKLKIGEDLGSSMRIKIFEDMMEMTRLGPSEKWRIDHFTSCKPAIIADVFTYPQCLVSSHALRPHVKLLGWSWMYFPMDLG